MGGKSGIQILDDINPANSQGAVGSFVSDAGNSINRAASDPLLQNTVAAAAVIGAGAYAAGAFDVAGGAAASTTGAQTAGASYLTGSATEAGASGVGYLGSESFLSGTGNAAAELGGVGASSSGALGYAGSYLGVGTGLTEVAGAAGVAAAPWYQALIPSGATALGLANTYINASRPSGSPGSISAPTSSGPAATIGRGYSSSPSSPGSTISIGGQGSATPQNAAAVSSTVAMGLGVIALLYLASKKRLI